MEKTSRVVYQCGSVQALCLCKILLTTRRTHFQVPTVLLDHFLVFIALSRKRQSVNTSTTVLFHNCILSKPQSGIRVQKSANHIESDMQVFSLLFVWKLLPWCTTKNGRTSPYLSWRFVTRFGWFFFGMTCIVYDATKKIGSQGWLPYSCVPITKTLFSKKIVNLHHVS